MFALIARLAITKSIGAYAACLLTTVAFAGDESTSKAFNRTPSDEQLAFFESKIRPLFVQHCYECHSAQASDPAGGLLLDSHAGIVRGGETGPTVVPGVVSASLLMKAVKYEDKNFQMPPAGKLTDDQLRDLEEWIKMGAPDPRAEDTVLATKAKKTIDWDKAREFWSLKPLERSSPPEPTNEAWPITNIDRFVLHAMKGRGLVPSTDASREAWIRRATYDLTGLPPTPEQIDHFLAEPTESAYATVVNRLLSTRAYGERWGRHWLDVVRYSDTAGDNADFPIPQMVRYRDWVIDSFCEDKPYDQFVIEQLAGDLLPSQSTEEAHRNLIATGYVAGARRFGSRVDDYPQHLTIEDTLDNVGRAFLATTINCARCHDHKFDPVTAEDYYALYGIFNSTQYPWPGIELEQKQRDLVPLAASDIVERSDREQSDRQKMLDEEVKRLQKEHQDASDDEAKKSLDTAIKKAKEIAERNSKQPKPYELAYALSESKKISDVPIQLKGDPGKAGDIASRHFLTMLGRQTIPASEANSTSGRLQLAHWITDRNNPLTARVMVNRIWLHHFGRGLVPTPNDFGRQGKLPTHPELLDWLANRFIDSDWSIKSLHREIMLSRVYRLGSIASSQASELDPTNELLSHYPRRRLDAESIRDTLLYLSGKLDTSRAEAHPFPPQDQWKFTQHNPFKAIYETNRRSVYLMTQRIQRHPFLAIFDGADPSVSTPARAASTTPLQALYFLNDPFVHQQAEGFAKRAIEHATSPEERVRFVYRLGLGRHASSEEMEGSLTLLKRLGLALDAEGLSAQERESQTWQSLVRSLFRFNEFVYLD